MPSLPLNTEFNQEKNLKRFIVFSLALHILLLIYLSLKSALFPDQPKEYLPSLRVDLVALPDLKKAEIAEPKAVEVEKPKEIEKPKEETPEVEKPVEKPKEKVKPAPKVQAKPDIKADTSAGDFAVKKKKKELHEKKEKEAQKKLKSALDRIKALERIKAMAGGDEIKGNRISKGSALSGEAKTSLETTYFDVVLERVRSNWELPKWLQDRELSATVMIYLDARGGLKSFKFTKSSGNEQFDNEVKRTLQASAPFPLPPSAIASDLSGSGISLGFPI